MTPQNSWLSIFFQSSLNILYVCPEVVSGLPTIAFSFSPLSFVPLSYLFWLTIRHLVTKESGVQRSVPICIVLNFICSDINQEYNSFPRYIIYKPFQDLQRLLKIQETPLLASLDSLSLIVVDSRRRRTFDEDELAREIFLATQLPIYGCHDGISWLFQSENQKISSRKLWHGFILLI